MRFVVHGLFLVLWGGCAFVLAWFVARRYITPGRRALAVGAAVAAAFVLGGVSPFSLRDAGSGSAISNAQAQPPPTVAAARPGLAAPAPEVQPLSVCTAALRVTSLRAPGSLDGLDIFESEVPVDRGSVPFVEPTDRLVLNGWATDEAGTAPAKGVCAVVDDRVVTSADVVYGRSRPDVAAARGRATLGASGFEVALLGSSLPKGKHVLGIAAVSADGTRANLVGTARTVDVR